METARRERVRHPPFHTAAFGQRDERLHIENCLRVSVGIYGIVGSWVSQHRREMAIRLALGATDGGVRLLVLRDGVRLILHGFLLGLPVAYAVSGVWVHLLFGVSRIDPWFLVILPVVFLLLGLTASNGPARAATRVHIVTALTEG